MFKCDMCVDLLVKGELFVCVVICLLEVIKFGLIDELCVKYDSVCDVNGLLDLFIIKFNLVVKVY